MYRLKRHNVVKVVHSEHAKNKLIGEGFILTSQPVFKAPEAPNPTAKPSVVVEEDTLEEELFDCPYCDKQCKSEQGLLKHIEAKHSEAE